MSKVEKFPDKLDVLRNKKFIAVYFEGENKDAIVVDEGLTAEEKALAALMIQHAIWMGPEDEA